MHAFKGTSMLLDYTDNERRLDGAVHLIGGIGAAIALPALLLAAPRDWPGLIAAIVYSAGLIAMLGFSAAYNLAGSAERRDALRPYDHAAIFLMIAGTYTPIALIGVGGAAGHRLLLLVWGVALGGALLKLLRPRGLERASAIPFLVLGWIGLSVIDELMAALPVSTLMLIGAGGLLYTLGVVFHVWTTLRHHNAIWHGFVLAGAACHYAAVFGTLG
jgi:hemolysin III